MSQTAALACAVIRQAIDDIEIYMRALARARIRTDEIGTAKHSAVLADKHASMVDMHRAAVCASAFLSGAPSHSEISALWFAASGLDQKVCRIKSEKMYPIRQLLTMG